MNLVIFYGYNFLGLKRFILNESTNALIAREDLLRFYIVRDMWTI
jgi:hypothetical protein